MAMLTHYCGALFGQGTCVVRCWDGQGGTGKGPYQVPINSLVIPVAVLHLGIFVYMSRHKQKIPSCFSKKRSIVLQCAGTIKSHQQDYECAVFAEIRNHNR